MEIFEKLRFFYVKKLLWKKQVTNFWQKQTAKDSVCTAPRVPSRQNILHSFKHRTLCPSASSAKSPNIVPNIVRTLSLWELSSGFYRYFTDFPYLNRAKRMAFCMPHYSYYSTTYNWFTASISYFKFHTSKTNNSNNFH